MADNRTKSIFLNLYKRLLTPLLCRKPNSYKTNIKGRTATEFPAKKQKPKLIIEKTKLKIDLSDLT